MLRKSASILTVLLAVACGAALPARSASLDADSCNRLKTEQDALEKGGVRASMAKGPEWAKANLAPDKLEEIRRTIELDEQLLFRCAGKPLVVLPPEADPAASPPEPIEGGKDEGKKAAPGAPDAKPAPGPQRKAAVAKEKVKGESEFTKGEDPKVKAKAKPKPKGKEDAYKAPPPDSANPFSFN